MTNRREELFQAGVQYGHRTQYWCPKMSPFIWGEKDGIHLINVGLTDIQIAKAEQLLESIAAQGLPILWVGTKKIARDVVSRCAAESNSPFFANRWVGGTLTNYSEVKKAVKNMLYNIEIHKKSGENNIYTKKELNVLGKKIERSGKIISGISSLSWPVGALIVMDVQRDKVAVKEAQRMGIPVIGLVDTNCDPEGITCVIPCNDDLEKAIAIVSQYFVNAINRGKEKFAIENPVEAAKEAIENKSVPVKKNYDQKEKTKFTKKDNDVKPFRKKAVEASEKTVVSDSVEKTDMHENGKVPARKYVGSKKDGVTANEKNKKTDLPVNRKPALKQVKPVEKK